MNNKDILASLKFRHACKDFDKNKKISDEDFDVILQAAHLSPSSYGFEPWKFLIIQNPEIRSKITEYTWGGQKQIPHSSHLVVILNRRASELHPNSEYLKKHMKNVQNLPEERIQDKTKKYANWIKNDFHLDSDKQLEDWAKRQTYIPLANMMTIAAQLGIDSCPIEGFNVEKVEKVLAAECDVDLSKFGVSVMVTFGYRILPQQPRTRKEIKETSNYII